MSVMDDRGMLRREQKRGRGARRVLDASGMRKYLQMRGFGENEKEHFADILKPVS